MGNSLVSFQPRGDGNGLHVRDELGDNEFLVGTDADVSLEQASPDRFVVPVDAAVSFTAAEIHLPSSESVLVRDGTGEHRAELLDTPESFPRGDYFLEISGTTKSYLALQDVSFTGQHVEDGDQRLPRVRFDEPTTVTLGTRSLHDRPRATITVPDDPRDLATAVSYLGSSIKEWSCERSWPTIRGHPPAIERGEELHVPDVLEKPDTGVTIAVPPTYADVYRIAPLAFYLGADVVPGETAELRLDVGHTEPLRRPGRTLEESVDRLLARCLLLDSLVRVGGYYTLPRYEYDEVAPHLPFYPPELYGRSVDEQLMEYLEVPFDVLEPYVPQRPLTVALRPDAADATMLPSLADTLARVRVSESASVRPAFDAADSTDSVALATTDRETPPGVGYLTPEMVSSTVGYTPTAADDLHVAFVAPDAEVSLGTYDTVVSDGRESTSGNLTVTADTRVTTDDLDRLLREGVDFLHFGGDVTDEGFVCADGVLPTDALEDADVTTFALSGPASFEAGVDLVENRAVAGVVAADLDAAEVGRLAGYLASGFPLAVAAELAEVSGRYRFVGDPSLEATFREGIHLPASLSAVPVDRRDSEGEFRITVTSTFSSNHEPGSVGWLADDFAHDEYVLVGSQVEQPFTLDAEEVAELLCDVYPVRCNGDVYHGEADPAAFVRRSARRTLGREHDVQ
ncbi:hypothetical protein [Halospeciosus flavus]|uniref:Uncharacterized protein n=1 Tax=Halospeciosus flavus TaxID=3032283 RepID=A0ABD5Z0L6_9EURY|nr:hypothetical protein [Halospeciosus flavus]